MNKTNRDDEAANNEATSHSSPEVPGTARRRQLSRHMKRFGVAGFLFFLIKGLLWLLIPLLLALGWFGDK